MPAKTRHSMTLLSMQPLQEDGQGVASAGRGRVNNKDTLVDGQMLMDNVEQDVDCEQQEEQTRADQSHIKISVTTEQGEGEDEDEDEEAESDAGAEKQGRAYPSQAEETSSEDTRTEEELNAVRYEILELTDEVPLAKRYKIVDRLGEGTFSSVYKAIDCANPFYDNSRWGSLDASAERILRRHLSGDSNSSSSSISLRSSASERSRSGAHRRSSSKSARETPYSTLLSARRELKECAYQMNQERSEGGNPVYVALKRIYVTSSPIRIYNELEILADLRQARNTAYLISAFRHEDQVIAVMPYERHQDFRHYYRSMSLMDIKKYLRCLLSALADCHELGIMHRDVKPANFLYNVVEGQGKLCDFGLAQRLNPAEWHGHCLHSLPQMWKHAAEGALHGQKLVVPKDVLTQQSEQWAEFTKRYALPVDALPREIEMAKDRIALDFNGNLKVPWTPSDVEEYSIGKRIRKEEFHLHWRPVVRHPTDQRVGHLKAEHEKRPSIRANRAGTRGFRAPEVVFKCPDQTMSLDICNDDTEALLEIAAIFGRRKMEKCGALHNRTFLTNIPNIENPTYPSLHELVRNLNPNIFVENMPYEEQKAFKLREGADCLTNPAIIKDLNHSDWYEGSDLWFAIDLLKRLLTLDCTKRITAYDSLLHPFLAKDQD